MGLEKGRGATHNHESARFNLPVHEADGDWLDALESIDGPIARLRTQVTVEQPRTIIARNSSPDIGFDRSINAYRGCDHPYTVAYAHIIIGKALLINRVVKKSPA